MVISQKQAFLTLAAACVFSGFFKLDFFQEQVSTVEKIKIASFHSSKEKQAIDYAGCLSNLTGLEHALFQAASESRIDPKLLMAVMTVESECTQGPSSAKGAVGLMQILPSTAKSLGEFNAHRPKDNIRAGAKYLRELKDKFGEDLSLTLAAYNAGPTAVRRYRGVPPYKETRNYVAKVLKVYSGYKL
jgi:soluble lytic murein transglycosylase-like protein